MGLHTGPIYPSTLASAAKTSAAIAEDASGIAMYASATVGIRFHGSMTRGKHYHRKLAQAVLAARDEVLAEMHADPNLKDVMPL